MLVVGLLEFQLMMMLVNQMLKTMLLMPCCYCLNLEHAQKSTLIHVLFVLVCQLNAVTILLKCWSNDDDDECVHAAVCNLPCPEFPLLIVCLVDWLMLLDVDNAMLLVFFCLV